MPSLARDGAPPIGGADGRRDYALLATMFNTGARVQELVAVDVQDLQLAVLPQVRFYGKGRKEWCRAWSQTADLLRTLHAERGPHVSLDQPVFRNHRGGRLTRFGVRYVLGKLLRAGEGQDTHVMATKRLPHSTAVNGFAASLLGSVVGSSTLKESLCWAGVSSWRRCGAEGSPSAWTSAPEPS